VAGHVTEEEGCHGTLEALEPAVVGQVRKSRKTVRCSPSAPVQMKLLALEGLEPA